MLNQDILPDTAMQDGPTPISSPSSPSSPQEISGDEVASLCQACQNAVFTDDSKDFNVRSMGLKPYLYHIQGRIIIKTGYSMVDSFPDLPNLQASSRNGCDLCGLIRDSILSDDADRAMKSYSKPISRINAGEISISMNYIWKLITGSRGSGLDGARVDIWFKESQNFLYMTFLAEAAPDDQEVASLLGIASPMQTFADAESMRWMKERLTVCLDHEHEQSEPAFIPERLLDVTETRTRLVSRDDLLCRDTRHGRSEPQDIMYAALSYCWGPPKDALTQLKATKATLPQLINGIDEESMTAILKDAVTITRNLSIPYLWVDALCILQDDVAEWEHQCADMDKIYGHAHVTLRAASAKSCHEGFLQQKGTRIRMPFSSVLCPNISGSYFLQLKAIGQLQRFNVYDSDQFQSPLHRRGWAYQEHVLSTRQIVFGASNIHFQCSQTIFSRGITEAKRTREGCVFKPTSAMSSDHLYDQWKSIIKAYSRYTGDSFTKASDTLPALSGLAALYGNRLRDDYLVGHWKRDLSRTLLWRRIGAKPKARGYLDRSLTPLDLYISPSWSALGKGATSWTMDKFQFNNFLPEVENINGATVLTGENLLGSVTSAKMEIRSHVLRLGPPWQTEIHQITYGGEINMEDVLVIISGLRLVCHLDCEHMDKESRSLFIANATLVLLGSVEPSFKDISLRGGLGLLLKPGRIPGTFIRIGVFSPDPLYVYTKDVRSKGEVTAKEMGDLATFFQLAEVRTLVVI